MDTACRSLALRGSGLAAVLVELGTHPHHRGILPFRKPRPARVKRRVRWPRPGTGSPPRSQRSRLPYHGALGLHGPLLGHCDPPTGNEHPIHLHLLDAAQGSVQLFIIIVINKQNIFIPRIQRNTSQGHWNKRGI